MNTALQQFNSNLSRVKNLGTIYTAMQSRTTESIDLSDILRAELVLLLSALDQYVHEIARIGMLEIYSTNRVVTPAFERFQMPLESVLRGLQDLSDDSWLDDQIRVRHGYQSFQHPDKIADAIRLFSQIRLWQEVAQILDRNERDVKQELILLVDRRNKIAHEADIDPSYPNQRWPIDKQTVDDAINFVEQIVNAIHQSIL